MCVLLPNRSIEMLLWLNDHSMTRALVTAPHTHMRRKIGYRSPCIRLFMSAYFRVPFDPNIKRRRGVSLLKWRSLERAKNIRNAPTSCHSCGRFRTETTQLLNFSNTLCPHNPLRKVRKIKSIHPQCYLLGNVLRLPWE